MGQAVMDIASLLAQGVQTRPAGMEQNALMQAQEFKQRQAQNALMQMQMQAAQEKRAQDQQNALMLRDWRNSLQEPQGQQFVQSGAPAMNAAQAESAAMLPGYGVSSAQPSIQTAAPDQRMVQAIRLAKMGQMGPADLFKLQNPEPMKLGKDDRLLRPGPNGSFRELVGAAPTGPKTTGDYADWLTEFNAGRTKEDFTTWNRGNGKSRASNISMGVDNLGLKPKERFEMEGKLADDYKGVTKLDNLVLSATSKIKTALAQKGALKDQAAIYSFAKMLDPEGAVREADYAAIANTTGLVDRVRGYLNRLMTGEQLNPAQRDEMAQLMTAFEGVANQRVSKAQADFTEQARRYNLRPEAVFGAKVQPQQPPKQEPQTKAGDVLKFDANGNTVK